MRYQEAEAYRMAMETEGDHSIERAWFDGVARFEEEAEALAYEANRPRVDARAARKAAMGPGGMMGG